MLAGSGSGRGAREVWSCDSRVSNPGRLQSASDWLAGIWCGNTGSVSTFGMIMPKDCTFFLWLSSLHVGRRTQF